MKLPLVSICVNLLMGLSATAFALDYQIVPLSGLPGCYAATPVSINSSGQLVINSYFDTYERAGIWQNGAVTSLAPLSGYASSWACKINASGQIVGYSCSGGASRACLWQNGTVIDLGWSGEALDINDKGQIAGRGDNATKVVLWENGSFRYVGNGAASAINNSGQIVGRDSDGNAVLWQGGTTTTLYKGSAADINDNGQVVGTSGDSYNYDACLWQNGTLLPLGHWGHSCSINNSGQIVGYQIGGVWQNGTVTPLPSADGYHLFEGLFISDSGQVIGWQQKWYESQLLNVLWQPVPEPSSLLVLICGMGTALGLRRGIRKP